MEMLSTRENRFPRENKKNQPLNFILEILVETIFLKEKPVYLAMAFLTKNTRWSKELNIWKKGIVNERARDTF